MSRYENLLTAFTRVKKDSQRCQSNKMKPDNKDVYFCGLFCAKVGSCTKSLGIRFHRLKISVRRFSHDSKEGLESGRITYAAP
ncbi:hypothetical protein ACTXT7_005263 [Hymenolepis weldensis]